MPLRAGLIILGAAAVVGCNAPVSLPAIPEPHLTQEDRDVMWEVLDLARYQAAEYNWRLGRVGPPMTAPQLVLDVTVPVCEPSKSRTTPPVVGCIFDHLGLIDQLGFRDNVQRLFSSRNSRSYPIAETDRDRTVLVSASKIGTLWDLRPIVRELRAAGIFVLSAPVYPSAGTALIFHRQFEAGGGFILFKRAGGRWEVAERAGWVE